jgi:hydroxymethylpyrimidine pyrophosphatase-like HAD family hydrolase
MVETPTIRLVSLDFDGTILTYDDPAGVFHPEAIAALNRLEGLGVRWCANSGRDLPDQLGVLERSLAAGLTHHPVALICSESLVYLREGNGYRDLDPWNKSAHASLRSCHVRVQRSIAHRLDHIQRTYTPISTLLGDLYTAFFVHDRDGQPERLHREMEQWVAELEGVMLTRNGGWVAAMPSELGKGNALAAYADSCGLTPDAILAVGDHFNDLTMLSGEAARHVGCPADAIPEVRQAVRRANGIVAKESGPLGTVEVISTLLG